MTYSPNIKEIPLPIVGGTAFGRYAKISTEETFNMMISDGALVPFPGYQKLLDLGQTGRSLAVSTKYNHLVAVVDNNLFTIGANNEVAKVGTFETSSGDVFIAENFKDQICIVDGLKPYIYNYAVNSFTPINGLDFLPNYITFQDGYFIATGPNTNTQANQFRLADLDDSTSWPDDSGHVGLLQSKPDITVAAISFNRQLYIFGRTVTEIWYDTGYQLFPYQRNNYYNIDYGCLNAATIAVGSIDYGDNNLIPLICWLGINEKAGPTIMYSTGGAPSQLSTDGINFKIEQLQNPETAYGFMFRLGGHTFYQVVWPLDNLSYAYDFNIHKFYTVTDENLNFHIAKRVAFFNNKYYFLSVTDGGLYEMATNLYTYNYDTDNDEPNLNREIPRIRITPAFRLPNSAPFIAAYADLTMEQGETTTEQAVDLSLSIDGGISYGSSARTDLNVIPDRLNRFREWGLGYANDFRMQYRLWGFNKFVIIGGVMGVYQ